MDRDRLRIITQFLHAIGGYVRVYINAYLPSTIINVKTNL